MNNDKRPLYIPLAGPALLSTPLLNKGSAFTAEERSSFNLEGLLPESTETIQEQVDRAYQQYKNFESDMDKHIYLRNIQDTNETLFYRLVQNHISEMMPIIYTPTVGAACENFSNIYRRGRGIFISYPNRDRIDDLINNATNHNVKVIVVTDGERILGLGDQGIGGMGIPIGKLALYTACGGISPAYTLPIVLDVGTNNPQRLADPMYMGWRHPRITGAEYNAFVEEFMQAVQRRWPDALIQFEDFAQKNAMPLLERYKDRVCCFNDDIQGTAAVTVGSLIAACHAAGSKLSEQRITFLGAGSAGCGIAEAIIAQMVSEGLSDEQARSQVYMVDRWGLLQEGMQNLLDFQKKLVQKHENTKGWESDDAGFSLLEVVKNAKPTVLIGVSGAPGLFSKEVIQAMHANCERPIVFPLSNPTSRVEATPNDIIRWTDGAALVATGSPFDPVIHDGKTFEIAQCNNSYIFPGIGLGVLAVSASRVTDEMLMESSRALAECSPLAQQGTGALLPPLEEIHRVSKRIAFAVGKKAIEQGVALEITDETLEKAIDQHFWQPVYRRYKRTAF
ncbi:NAD-dependent malic enzyme [Vibrio nigripulchritudo MADA3029]|uniref:NAD-dependent malic enzyme n=1 Tax=Vibrio nigripulchritudo SOn1 TaxID=1238450 RepID=A0AAV2W074_9VIBR|nr:MULTISPECIES: NAD-dependent malic enzyme [Vibrio]UAB71614.1 NAD-dependent malic enzyme [Vibrio sp. SCSIO 43132]CCN34122.1 NAD-dependent malic enzyme [Vibrio nigripulchritudo AM115]CCN43564.1 NAD-dependent malic enzyme [Vibrio nigripulchritudo FTn2]CCN49398.1 NAD-dependent malic enzyme [Vibrio nigripulchritudo MADA3020]CCN51551.1 NAD-dependent malic enzyme [Vibrio nigripulchritudo MADA3021]